MSEDRAPEALGPDTTAAIEWDVAAGEIVPGMAAVPVGGAPPAFELPAAAPPATTDHFYLSLRGYDRNQVDDYVARISVLVGQLRAEAATAAARSATAEADLARVRGELERGRPSFDALGERVSQMLGLAESEADQMRTDAGRDAAQIRSDAEQEAADVRALAQREAEELGASARRELGALTQHRVELLTEIARMRDTLNGLLAGAGEQWPSLAPTQVSDEVEIDLTGAPFDELADWPRGDGPRVGDGP
jgi:cell division septum initiation protein DivIVA